MRQFLFRTVATITGAKVEFKKYNSGDKAFEAITVTGPTKAVSYLILAVALIGDFLGIDNIAMIGLTRDGENVHMVFTDKADVNLTVKQASDLRRKGYTYGHYVSLLKDGVTIGYFDKGFDPNDAGKGFGQIARALFAYGNGTIFGANTNTLLLTGRSNKDRVLVACKYGYKSPLTAIDLPQNIGDDVRSSVCSNDTVLIIGYNTGRIAALHVEQIVKFVDLGVTPTWQTKLLDDAFRIEDISVSIEGTRTVVVTVKQDGRTKLIPATIVWAKDGDTRTFGLAMITTSAADLPDNYGQIVRMSPKGRVATVDGRKGANALLAIGEIDRVFDKKTAQALRRMATDAGDKVFDRASAV